MRNHSRLALAVLAAAIVLATAGAWLGARALLPLLYALPCAAMMAMCMKGHGDASAEKDARPDPDSGLSR